MNNSQQAAMTFATSSEGRIVHIDDVSNGAQCDCHCPQCHTPLIAKNGGHERAHHFAHDGSTEAQGCAETAIHLAAKQIVVDYRRLTLPKELGDLEVEFCRTVELDSVTTEHTLFSPTTSSWVIADCYAIHNSNKLIAEIAVHHKVDDYKARQIRDLGIPAIEINLHDQIGKAWTWDELEYAVIFEPTRRHWICAPQEIPDVELASPPLTTSTQNEWVFAVGATRVLVKELPFGNVKVFHRIDDQARQVVEPICRTRGYWNAKYKNWIVFDKYKTELLQLLAMNASPIHAL